jgi:hypothetical protein
MVQGNCDGGGCWVVMLEKGKKLDLIQLPLKIKFTSMNRIGYTTRVSFSYPIGSTNKGL